VSCVDAQRDDADLSLARAALFALIKNVGELTRRDLLSDKHSQDEVRVGVRMRNRVLISDRSQRQDKDITNISKEIIEAILRSICVLLLQSAVARHTT
jgi:hypothetical protein